MSKKKIMLHTHINIDPIHQISGLVVDLNSNTMFNSSGKQASIGEYVTDWGNAVKTNDVTGATLYNGTGPVMANSDGVNKLDFSGTDYGMTLGDSETLNFGGPNGEFTVIMQDGGDAKDVYWIISARDNQYTAEDWAFDWYGNTYYFRINGWASTNITWPTIPSVMTMERNPNPGQTIGYLNNVARVVRTTPVLVDQAMTHPIVICSDGIGAGNGYTFKGSMRRCLIWNRALTTEERTFVHEQMPA